MQIINKNFKIILGIIISLVALCLCFIVIDTEEVSKIILSANYIYVIPAIILYFFWLYVRSIRLKYMISQIHYVSIKNIYLIELIGYMSNNILPMRMGEIIRCAYLCKKEKDIKFSTAAAILFIERSCEAVALLVLGLISISILIYYNLFIHFNGAYNTILMVVSIIVLVLCSIFIFVAIIAAKNDKIAQLIFTINIYIFRKYASRVNIIIGNFLLGLKILKSIKVITTIFFSSCIIWILETLMYIIVAYSFDINLNFTSFAIFFIAMLAVVMISNLFGAIPASIGGIGVFEIAAQQALIALGIDSATAILYSLVLHIIVFMVPITIVGLLVLWIDNLSISKMINVLKQTN